VLVHDLNKQHAKYKKSHHKYTKLVKDAEASIKAREDAILHYAARVSRSEKEATAQDVTSYLNRGLNKMISKIIPTDDFKRIHDRCRSLLSEVEDLEVKLVMDSDQLKILHDQLQDKSSGMTKQIELLEEQRLENTKDGLLRFCQASEGMLEHNKNILNDLRDLTTAAATESVNVTSNTPAGDAVDTFSRSEDMVALEMELALLINIMRDTDATYDNSSSNNNSTQRVSALTDIQSDEESSSHPTAAALTCGDDDLNIEIHLLSFKKLKSAMSALANMNYQVCSV
jgi:hypothetical protein